MDDHTTAIEFLKNCHFMTIAVIANGEPWAVPVHIQRHEGLIFEWDSHPEALHSLAIMEHPRVSLSMYRLGDGNVNEFGFYAQAEATKIADLSDKKAKYRAVVTAAWVNDEKHRKRAIEI